MPRNGSGTYNLPAGNPVVGGTTIASGWANTTLSDLASALTGSLATDGQTVMTGPLQTISGSAATPAIGPVSSPTTGLFFGINGQTTIVGEGVFRAVFTADGVTVGPLFAPVQQTIKLSQGAGANLSPGLVMSRSTGGVGWFQGVNANGATIFAANPVGYSDVQLNAATKFLITGNGEVALNSSGVSPVTYGGGYRTLEVMGANSTDGGVIRTTTNGGSIAADYFTSGAFGGAVLRTYTNHPMLFKVNQSTQCMSLNANGSVTFGTMTPTGLNSMEVGTNGAAATSFSLKNSAGAVNFSLTAAGAPSLIGTANQPLTLGANGGQQLVLTGDGRLYGTALHNNAGSVAGATNQHLASGTYTPSMTAVANCSAPTGQVHQWIRVGNVVHVSGVAQITVTAASTPTSFRVALPIASAFSTSYQLNGAINVSVAASTLPYASADTTNDQALVQFTSGASTGAYQVGYSLQYEVL
jgi:hypothetical protein